MLNMTNYEQALNEEILSELEIISKADLSDEGSERLINNVKKLIDSSIDLKKIKLEEQQIERKSDEHAEELVIKASEIQARSKEKKMEQGTKIALFIGSALIAVCGTVYTTQFEKDDNYSYSASKEFAKGVINFFKGKI